MDKSPQDRLVEEAALVGVSLPPDGAAKLIQYAELLSRWNRRIRLTGARSTEAILGEHVLDALALVPELKGAGDLLDLGSGAGLPGIPLAVALPQLRVHLIDAIGKKVAFLKSAIATLSLVGRVRASQIRLQGNPGSEGVVPAGTVVARALLGPEPYLLLAKQYAAPQGRILCLLGTLPSKEMLTSLGERSGVPFVAVRNYRLPNRVGPRTVAVFRKP